MDCPCHVCGRSDRRISAHIYKGITPRRIGVTPIRHQPYWSGTWLLRIFPPRPGTMFSRFVITLTLLINLSQDYKHGRPSHHSNGAEICINTKAAGTDESQTKIPFHPKGILLAV